MAKQQKKSSEEPKLIPCRAITRRWGELAPGLPRRLIEKGATVMWPADKKVPRSLKPIEEGDAAEDKTDEPATPEPSSLSEVQHRHPARRPEGA